MSHERRTQGKMLALQPNKSWANARRVTRPRRTLEESGILTDRDGGIDAILALRQELARKKNK